MKKIYAFLMVMLAAIGLNTASAKDVGGTLPGGVKWGYVDYNQMIWITGADSMPDFSYTTYYKGDPMCPAGMDKIDITDAPWAGLQTLVKYVRIDPIVTYIGANAFRGFHELVEVSIERDPEDLIAIGDNAFDGCSKLSVMNFQNVAYLGEYSFAGTAFSYVELPNVRHIGSKPFANCENMRRTEVENFVVVNENIRPSVYINTRTVPEMDGYLSNIGLGEAGGIDFLVLVRYELKDKWDINQRAAHNGYRMLPGGDFGINSENGLRSFWYIKYGTVLVVNCAYGKMPNFNNENSVPWRAEKDNIYRVLVFDSKRIGKYAFKDFSKVQKVETDLSLEEVGDHAFDGCSEMWKTKFESVTKIGTYAFKGCKGFYGSGYFPACKEIGANAFENACSILIFGYNLEKIGANAFKGISSLYLRIRNCTPPQLDANTFAGMDLSKISLEIPAACAQSYTYAPWSAMEIHYMTGELPIRGDEWSLDEDGKLEIWKKSVVKDYASPELVPWHGYRDIITGVYYTYSGGNDAPKGVGANMFCDMPELTTAWFGAEGAKIGKQAFYNCPKLYDLGSSYHGITEIGDYAFAGCHSLPIFQVDETCTKLGQHVFYECDSLKDFYCYRETPPTVDSKTFNGLDQSKVVLHVKNQVNYMNANYWKNFAFEGNDEHGNILKTGTFFDGNFILYSDGYLYCKAEDPSQNKDATESELYAIRTQPKEIVVEGQIDRITNCFLGFTNLTKVTLPATVTRLVQTFLGCKKLEEVTMQGVTYLGIGTFRDCSALKTIDLSSVKTIEDNCFDNSGLTSVDVVQATIGDEAFRNCAELEKVYLEQVKFDGTDIFKGCSELTTVHFDSRVLKAGMFSGCSNLERVFLYSKVQSIEEEVFTGTALKSLTYLRARPAELEYSGYENIFSGVPAANITLYVPKACIETFRNAHTWRHMTIEPSPSCSDSYLALPWSGMFANPDDSWYVGENKTLTIESYSEDGEMTEWPSNFDLADNPLEQWMPYFNTIEVVGETTRTMDNMIPSDRSMSVPGVSKIVLGKNIKHVGKSFDKIYHIEDVYCYAEDVPDIDANAFDWNMVADNVATLHVSKASGVKEAYKAHNLWKKFFVKADLDETYRVTLEADYGYIEVQENVNLNFVPKGTVLHFTAVPLETSRFVEWENYNPATGLTVNSDITVRATFESTLGIESIQPSEDKVQKVLFNGQLLIVMPDGAIYTVQGQRMR